ncbi:hypothetical protein N431DRAFT_522911 [Stipitochalara longipes BDJ]|nr:hypothetical protein N431DRAFT_522911 [Stipitochalara longipes BDJ]
MLFVNNPHFSTAPHPQNNPMTPTSKATTPAPARKPCARPALGLSVASATTEERLETTLNREASASDAPVVLVLIEECVYLGAALPVPVAVAREAVKVREGDEGEDEDEMVNIEGLIAVPVEIAVAVRVPDRIVVSGSLGGQETSWDICFCILSGADAVYGSGIIVVLRVTGGP